MKTAKRTTYILLERGDEDLRLKDEIDRAFSRLGIENIKQMAKEFPMLLELRQGLADELFDAS